MRNLKNKLILRKPQGFADKYPLISIYGAFLALCTLVTNWYRILGNF